MRIRNKELRQRWHRKEQRVKELIREARAAAAKAPKAVGDPSAAKPKAAPKRPTKPAARAADAEAKPKKATRAATTPDESKVAKPRGAQKASADGDAEPKVATKTSRAKKEAPAEETAG